MDTSELPLNYIFPEVAHPNKNVSQSLEAAHHFKHLHETKKQTQYVSECLEVMSSMVNRIYTLLEAVASLRAKYHHSVHLSRSPLNNQDQLLAEYEDMTRELGTGTLSSGVFGPLVAFLVSGVKGLMIYPNDKQRFGALKLSHFLVLVDKINGTKSIEEPIWKYTQQYILDTIQHVFFAKGFDPSNLNDVGWQECQFSKMQLAKALEVDLYNFCTHRPTFSGGEIYNAPLFDLPDIPAGKDNSKKKRVCNVISLFEPYFFNMILSSEYFTLAFFLLLVLCVPDVSLLNLDLWECFACPGPGGSILYLSKCVCYTPPKY